MVKEPIVADSTIIHVPAGEEHIHRLKQEDFIQVAFNKSGLKIEIATCGCTIGSLVGAEEGILVGMTVGWSVGDGVGAKVGDIVGGAGKWSCRCCTIVTIGVGAKVGELVGIIVGTSVG